MRVFDGVVVIGDPTYYSRFGCVPAAQFGLTCARAAQPEHFMISALAPGALDACSPAPCFTLRSLMMSEPVATASTDAAAALAPPTLALVFGEAVTELPLDLYIPPDALRVLLDSFEGPLDLLLYLIRKQNIDILDIPMARVTAQYMEYVNAMQVDRLELAAEYLLMAAMLIEIKSRLLLPKPSASADAEADDPRAELVRRLLEYEQIKLAAYELDQLPQAGRDFQWVTVLFEKRPGGAFARSERGRSQNRVA